MKTGTVVDGKIVVRDESLPDGARVTVFFPEQGDPAGFVLSAAEEAELLEAVKEADRGELISGQQVLRELGLNV